MLMAKMFLVDDDRAIIEVYHNMLEIKGHEVIGEAFDGENAVIIYEELEVKPDIILMDHRMPFKCGIRAMKDIHAINPTQCVIFVTADFEAAKDALNKGAQSFIMKPFRMDDLFNSIEMALLEKKREGSKLRESYLGYITRVNDAGGTAALANICGAMEKDVINKFIPEPSLTNISLGTTINWFSEFFNTMGMNYTYEREQDKFIIRNNKCIWVDELGPNPHFCLMAKCVISKFAMKTGREFNLELNSAIMDGSEECVFELNFI